MPSTNIYIHMARSNGRTVISGSLETGNVRKGSKHEMVELLGKQTPVTFIVAGHTTGSAPWQGTPRRQRERQEGTGRVTCVCCFGSCFRWQE